MPIPHPIADDADALAWYRELGNAELLATVDALRYALADPPADPATADVAGLLARPRLRAAERELARRARLAAAGADVPHPDDARYHAWRDLAQQVRDRADIGTVFSLGHHRLERRGATEFAGPCLACGGEDRLRVFTDRPGRYWCRRCGLTGDAITAYRSLIEPGFFAALRILAPLCGLALPSEALPSRAEGEPGVVPPTADRRPPPSAERQATPWSGGTERPAVPRRALPPRFELRAGHIARR